MKNYVLKFTLKINILIFIFLSMLMFGSTNSFNAYADVNEYVLKDSTVCTDFDQSWLDYNCYAFAIERDERVKEYESKFQYQVGDFSHLELSDFFSMEELVSVVMEDLEALDYEIIQYSMQIPIIEGNEKLICMRSGDYYDEENELRRDYHFMKYKNGSWYHKPGQSQILKFNDEPNCCLPWINEHAMGDVAVEGTIEYNSSIYYVVYKTPYETNLTHTTAEITNINYNPAYLDIPEKINGRSEVSIGNNAFENCSSINAVSIPATVTSIGNQAFSGCTNLDKVVMYNQTTVPTLGTSCFSSTSSNLKIYVPENLYNTYKTAPNWSNYANCFQIAYYDANGAYLDGNNTQIISMEDYVYYETLYVTGTEEDGFLTDEVAIIGFNLSEYYAHCYLDYYSTTVYSCRLIIEVEEQSGTVIVLDDDGSFVCEGEIEDGILSIPFTEIWNDSGEFYIFPEEGSDEIIEFVAEDVFLEVTYKDYL